MTVYNTSYSSIDEAWADSYLSPSLQKKQKKKKPPPQSDPICDLYAMGSTHYTDPDIVSYANRYSEMYDRHEKASFQHPMMDTGREKLPKVVEIDASDDPLAEYGAPVRDRAPPTSKRVEAQASQEARQERPLYEPEEDDEDEYATAAPPPRRKDPLRTSFFEEYEDDDFNKKNGSFNYFDIVLYVISGIILIFMMEQFVKIGSLLAQH